MRAISRLGLVAVLVGALGTVAFGQGTTTVHKYDWSGFSVSLPSTCQPVSLGNISSNAELQEAYQANGLAYLVLAISSTGSPALTAHAAVNLAVQSIAAAAAKVPGAYIHLISATTAQGASVQGFALTATDSKGGTGKLPPEVKTLFGNSLYQAAVLAPVVESPAVIAVLAVVGPPSRQGNVDSQLQQTVGSFTLANPGAAGITGTHDVWSGPGSKGSKTPAAPPQPDIKPFNVLKKGQIEFVGVVKSTDTINKSVDMLVGQAVPFGGHGTMISPPRLKRVYVKEIAEGVKEGAVIIVVAKDTGPGKSVTADTITIMDLSKLGF